MERQQIATLVEQYGNAVYGFCLRLAGTRAAADDLYQQTFLKAVELAHKINPAQNPKGFLLALAAKIWQNCYVKESRRKRIAPCEPFPLEDTYELHDSSNLQQSLEEQEERQVLRGEVDRLKPAFRIPIVLYYTSQLSISQIATILHLPKGTVKSRLFKARSILKQRLEKSGYAK